jgi:hypothetical protein
VFVLSATEVTEGTEVKEKLRRTEGVEESRQERAAKLEIRGSVGEYQEGRPVCARRGKPIGRTRPAR